MNYSPTQLRDLQREEKLALADWSESRSVARLRALNVRLETERDARNLGAAASTASQLALEVGDTLPVFLEGEHLPGQGAVEDGEGQGVRYDLPLFMDGKRPARPVDPVPSAEVRRVKELRTARSARDGARTARQVEAVDSWKREVYTIMGPAKSYLPTMDPVSQSRATRALGRAREMRTPDFTACELEALKVAVREGLEELARLGRKHNRRSTRGKGKRCRKQGRQ